MRVASAGRSEGIGPGMPVFATLRDQKAAPRRKGNGPHFGSAARAERVALSQYLVGQFHLGMPPPGQIPLCLQLAVLDQVADTRSNGVLANRIAPALEPHPSNDHCHLGPLCSGGRQDEAIEIMM